jgi:pimeloyl-ACP methyl ester carboxylesterase
VRGSERRAADIQRQTRSGGVDIVFEDTGHGEPAIVLIHPAASDRSHYAAVVSRLGGDRRVVALDLPGHGESGVPADDPQITDLAQAVVAVCREAGIGRALYCGHSMGGAVALVAAGLDRPRAAGVVLLDGAVLLPDPIRRESLEALVPALQGPQWLEALRGYFGERMFGPFDPPELKSTILEELAAAHPQVIAPLMRDLFSQDFADAVHDAPCPLLYIHARIPADLGRLKELRPNALIGSVVGSGHYMALVVPEQVAAMLERFLAILPLVPLPE